MILKDCQESWLITNVCDLVVVEVVETLHKRCRSSKQCDQGCLVVGYEAVKSLSVMLQIYLSGFFNNEYSQIELSKVSAAFLCKEQTLLGLLSILEHFNGS